MLRVSVPCRRFCVALAAALLLAGLPAFAQGAASGEDPRLAQVRELLDRERPQEALELLDAVLKEGKPSAEALLLRSTGRVMVSDVDGGFKDLQRALRIDPTLRQAWLNLAGLEIAEQRYGAAYDALVEAQKLDPSAADNDLNLGAVLLMQGQLERADGHFERYLARAGSTADAHFLVASNYALAGREDRALESLRHAIELDERTRLRARADSRFLALDGLRFQALLAADTYVPPPGAHTRAAAFRVPYDPKDNRLLFAVVEALNRLGVPYEPSVETTAGWALIWADMRIKVHNQANGTGVVSLSAPAERFTADEWQRRSQELFAAVHGILGE